MKTSATPVASEDVVTLHATLRFAVGVTAAFVAGEAMGWFPSFLAPVLTAALLASLPARPPLRMGLGLMVVMTVAALFAFVMASQLRGTPFVLFGLIALCVFLAFFAMLSGRPAFPALLFLICLATIPVIVMTAPAQAGALPVAFVRGMGVALVTIWLVYALWPQTAAPKPAAPAPSHMPDPITMALGGAAVVVPLMLVYLLYGLTDALPVMIATVMLVANFDLHRGRLHALAMIVGNFAGGFLGLLLHTLLVTTPTLTFLAVLLFFALLFFGQRLAAGGPTAPIALLACNAMLIILGSAISSDSPTLSLWMVRVFQFAVAGLFAIGTMSLLWHRASQANAK